MYNRAKYHPHITDDMKKAMKLMKNWLDTNINKSYKYDYLDLEIIKKYEPLAKKYNISKKFLTIYKKYGKAKLPFIPLFIEQPIKGDYDIYRELCIKKILKKMKIMKIPLYYKDGKYKNLPTKQHLKLIFYAYSPKKLIN